MTNNDFYRNLFIQHMPIQEVLLDPSLFENVPDNWNIIVTDVQNSTAAVGAGNHQLVNLAATGSIVACLNIARDHQVMIPFFFGGDGATIIVPDLILKECLHALILHQENCQSNFDFFLRVDSCKVGDMYKNGATLKITKVKLNDLHIIPVVLGDALQMAEDEVKSRSRKMTLFDIPYNLNLKGMECKWDKIAPPVDDNEILTLIIKAETTNLQSSIYSEVLSKMETIYGDVKKRHPITSEKLIMINSLDQLKSEVLMKFSELKWKEVLTSALRSIMARWYLKNNKKGRDYLRELPELTESLMVDGTINTVISGTKKQRELLLFELQSMQDKGLLRYGFYVSKTSILSCYVTAIDDYHVHFLDGDQGGYTQASKLLKV
ncbi:hypothetical protein BST92_11025 [Nonlabens arenilitoris]|uniref:DUF3095 domain-containing protein n=1 Tax=Nonlabens arenilitoris TaxID=1217969 RepID=A0A2S7UBW9_9FLAO|nr:DUF3095 family protein [Nonlabens arenilitoris]PQJ32425.1 hypothetical protein BST92_11025 [Nonlabens arenilitoris]